MHVLMVSDVYFPRINGVCTSIATFRRSLRALGTRCTLVAPAYESSGAEPAGAEPDGDVCRVASRRVPLDPEGRLMRGGSLLRALERIDHRGIDVVHVQTPFLAHRDGARFRRAQALRPAVRCWSW
jgi:hypothetical protein